MHHQIEIRQMAVRADLRRAGIGLSLMRAMESRLRSLGCATATLDARQAVEGFYLALGYTPVPPIFQQLGIPHVRMTKPLA